MQKKIILLFLIIAVIGCTRKIPTTSEQVTGPETPCSSNSDCKCRNFNGFEFTQGTSNSVCCKEDNKNQGGCMVQEARLNHCTPCIYE